MEVSIANRWEIDLSPGTLMAPLTTLAGETDSIIEYAILAAGAN